MENNEKAYYEKVDIDNELKLRKQLAALPPYCKQYFIAIESLLSYNRTYVHIKANFQKSGNFYFFVQNPTFRIYGKCTLNLRKSLYNFMSIPNHYRIGEVRR